MEKILSVISGSDITITLQKALLESSKVRIPEGKFFISDTILLPSGARIIGSGEFNSEIHFSDDVNKNMFTNSDYQAGNSDITIENLSLDGNWKNQRKPENEKRISFCNMFYFAKSNNLSFKGIRAFNCYQTVLHFNNSKDIFIEGLHSENLGWSGISTSGSDNIVAKNVYIYNSGNDHRHSAIHLDGGRGAYLECTVIKCNGNGVMLDSTFSDFSHAVVTANCSECMRGVSLIGSPKSQPKHILVKSGRMSKNQIGVMVSNSREAFIDGVVLDHNSEVGVLFQGRVGGLDSMVTNCEFIDNVEDIKEIHESKNNLFFNNKGL